MKNWPSRRRPLRLPDADPSAEHRLAVLDQRDPEGAWCRSRSHVVTGCSSLSADAGTHPVVPFGRTGSRTRSHVRPRDLRAVEHHHEVVGALRRAQRQLGHLARRRARLRPRPLGAVHEREVRRLPRPAEPLDLRGLGRGRGREEERGREHLLSGSASAQPVTLGTLPGDDLARPADGQPFDRRALSHLDRGPCPIASA